MTNKYTYRVPKRRNNGDKRAWAWAFLVGLIFWFIIVALFSQCVKERESGCTYRAHDKQVQGKTVVSPIEIAGAGCDTREIEK